VIAIWAPEDAQARLAAGPMCCPDCAGPLAGWRYGRQRTVRALGAATVMANPDPQPQIGGSVAASGTRATGTRALPRSCRG
jgi:hypothetical protein